jgi:hypothetical protein
LHDKVINSKNYKQKECNSFYQKGYCPYGPRCHFKHEERTLNDVIRPYYPFLLISKNTIDKFQYQLKNNNQFLSQLLERKKKIRSLKAFEDLRQAPPTHPFSETFKIPNFEEIKTPREFILPRKVFDSYM